MYIVGNFCSPERDDAVYRLAEAMQKLGTEVNNTLFIIVLIDKTEKTTFISARSSTNLARQQFHYISARPE